MEAFVRKKGKLRTLHGNSARGFIYSQRMKRNPTKAEQRLKEILDANDIYYKFQSYFYTRKKLFIPDFRLTTRGGDKKIILEVDGSSHDMKGAYDAMRTQWLEEKRHCLVVGFRNEQVLNEPNTVLSEILKLNPKTNKEREIERVRSMPTWRYMEYLKEQGLTANPEDESRLKEGSGRKERKDLLQKKIRSVQKSLGQRLTNIERLDRRGYLSTLKRVLRET